MYICVYMCTYTHMHTYILTHTHTLQMPETSLPTRDCDSIGLREAPKCALEHLAQGIPKQVLETNSLSALMKNSFFEGKPHERGARILFNKSFPGTP